MGKKTLILTDSQLNEICGSQFTYYDNTPQYNSNQVYVSDVNINNSNPTGDDIATDQPNVNRRATRIVNGRANGLMESNSNIQNLHFGAENGDTGHTAAATEIAKRRFEDAKQTVMTGSTPEEKAKAQRTIDRMKQNSPNIEQQINQYDAAIKNDRTIRQNKVNSGQRVIRQHTKVSGNGQGHVKNNGIITYEQ